MSVEPVPNEPALLIDGDARSLLVADIHLGVETELRRSGVILPSQSMESAERILAVG